MQSSLEQTVLNILPPLSHSIVLGEFNLEAVVVSPGNIEVTTVTAAVKTYTQSLWTIFAKDDTVRLLGYTGQKRKKKN